MSQPSVFFAMHDVTPFHRERLERAESLLEKWGVKKLLYLLVPNYHGAHRADENPAFQTWCRGSRPFEVQWFLHGYFHLLVPGDQTVEQLESGTGHGRITGGQPVGSPRSDEAEFSQLSLAAYRDRLNAGRAVFRRCLGFDPAGFVAPKWMGSRHLNPLLADLGFQWTEDARSVCCLSRAKTFSAPVITWATRAWWRRQSSLWGCPVLFSLWRHRPILRIAMHPFDFDHPAVVDSTARIVSGVLETHDQEFYAVLLSGESRDVAA
jgi:predicted deacetylase